MRATGLLGWFCIAAVGAGAGSAAQSVPSGPSSVRAAHERALEDPFDDARFRAYLATLPRDGEFYVIEGDLLRTAVEVRSYLAAQSQGQSRAGIRPELLVNVHDGQRDYYASPEARQLRYFVDRDSFGNTDRYERALTAVRKAADEWQSACPECQIKLTEIQAAPSGPEARTGFIVRQHDAEGAYVAAAFFPHDSPARRILNVDPSFFTTSFDSVGVLRHELGHVLGYRHEHTRGIPGCGFEDNRWQPLTSYDPHSVMHYFCGGGGSLQLNISGVDIAGHRALYGGPSSIGALTAPPGGGSPAAVQAVKVLQDARTDPFDETRRQALLKTLPRAGEYYIVEGDLKMTEQEVTAYLASAAEGDVPTQRTPELLVNLHSGRPDFYPLGQRKLTYVIDRASFGEPARYNEAAKAMKDASEQWEAICSECGLDFEHLQQFDDRPAAAKANFTVRLLDAGGEFIAAAFFPHDPPARRLVDIDPSFFSTTFDKAGVLRHELGHVIGYRHEHIRGVPGCFREDRQWRPLTAYDPRSVMHYFCGGAGSLKLDITPTDRAGHHRLYDPPSKSSSSPPAALREEPAGVLVVSFEGGEVVDNAADVLSILNDMKLLPVATRTIVKGDQLASVYTEHLGLPSYSDALTRLANKLNRADYDKEPLLVGQKVQYPDVRFISRTWGKMADRKEAAQIEQNWKHIIVEKAANTSAASGGYQRVELRAYELRLPVKEMEKLLEARARISKLGPNVLAGVETVPAAAKYYSAPDAAPTSSGAPAASSAPVWNGEESTILSSLGLSELTGERVCQGVECPEVVLLDKPLFVHPDLKEAVPGEDPDRTFENEVLLRDGKSIIEVIDWNDDFHSTHLAGIIASRRNGFGVIGVDPQARITWWNWNTLSTRLPTVASKVSGRQAAAQNSGAFQIYVFATSWQTPSYLSHDAMMADDGLAKRFKDEAPLVVAAAGEADRRKNEQPQDIGFKTTQAPMNQGDLPHVIVVTGCQPCDPQNARLLPDANYSKEFVHVAAPATDVLSTVWGAKYAKGSGTSQATALVAGLASAMVARYPVAYKYASQVKMRLQVTSTPIELAANGAGDGGKLAAGIIDPGLATRDPRKHWLKVQGADPLGFDDITWKVDSLKLSTPNGDKKFIATDEIWRITILNGRAVVYTGSRGGPIHKIGPGVLSTSANGPICTLGTTPVSLGVLETLVLRYPTSTQ